MIKNLSIKNKKIIIILVILALVIPFLIFLVASNSETKPSTGNNLITPTKEPLPTFPDAPRVENELIIQYALGQEFDNLSIERQQEIMEIFQRYGVISQEKAYPEVVEGELSRSYLIKFSGTIDIESVANKIYELPEIEGAQPNTEFGLF